MQKQSKRDFVFIDEAGDPGTGTDYYIVGLVHVTDSSLLKINPQLGAFRYFGNIRRELKSTKLSALQKEILLSILKFSLEDRCFVRASAIYIDKKKYQGPYLEEKENYPKDATRFRHLAMRRLLEFHFRNNQAQSREVELIIDRFHSSNEKEQQMRNYLRTDACEELPDFLHITQADSQYVEFLQIADWIAGSAKEKFFAHPEREFQDLFSYILVEEVVR